MKHDYLLVFIILLEIAYIVLTDKNDYHLKSWMGEFQLWKIGAIGFIGIFTLAVYAIAYSLRLNLFLFTASALLLLFIYVNYKLNNTLTNKTISMKEALSRMKTGDYIFYRTPKTLETVFEIIPVIFLGIYHLGVVMKDESGTFILETMPYKRYCEYSKKEKRGVILLDAKKRLEEHVETVYYVDNNLKPHIDKSTVYDFIDTYKDCKYMEKNVNCNTLVLLFLEYFGLIHKEISQRLLFLPYTYLLKPENYRVDFQYSIYKITN